MSLTDNGLCTMCMQHWSATADKKKAEDEVEGMRVAGLRQEEARRKAQITAQAMKEAVSAVFGAIKDGDTLRACKAAHDKALESFQLDSL